MAQPAQILGSERALYSSNLKLRARPPTSPESPVLSLSLPRLVLVRDRARQVKLGGQPDGLLDRQKGVEHVVLHDVGRDALKVAVVARLAVGEHPSRERRAFGVLNAACMRRMVEIKV